MYIGMAVGMDWEKNYSHQNLFECTHMGTWVHNVIRPFYKLRWRNQINPCAHFLVSYVLQERKNSSIQIYLSFFLPFLTQNFFFFLTGCVYREQHLYKFPFTANKCVHVVSHRRRPGWQRRGQLGRRPGIFEWGNWNDSRKRYITWNCTHWQTWTLFNPTNEPVRLPVTVAAPNTDLLYGLIMGTLVDYSNNCPSGFKNVQKYTLRKQK